MNNELILPSILLLYVIIREWQHERLINKLIDKLMSRNYYDYKISGAVADTSKQNGVDLEKQRLQVVQEQQQFQQDLGSLTGIV